MPTPATRATGAAGAAGAVPAAIRVAVVDDEPLARERICRLLAERGEVEVVGTAANGVEGAALVEAERPDVLFLDIQMPGADGFAALARVAEGPLPETIFVTAYDEYALRAFDAHAADYLLKPYTAERFWEAFRRARERVAMQQALRDSRRLSRLLESLAAQLDAVGAAAPPAPAQVTGAASGAPRWTERFPVQSQDRTIFVRVADVDWIEASGNYVRLHVGRSHHLVRDSLGALEERLDPRRFVRVHRRAIVNIARIRELQPWYSGDQILLLTTGAQLRVSRRYRAMVAERLALAP